VWFAGPNGVKTVFSPTFFEEWFASRANPTLKKVVLTWWAVFK